jgi:hypothetical protein
MFALLCFVLAILVSPFKSRSRLEAENAVLRHQLSVLRRKLQGRVLLTNNDRWLFVQLYRWCPSILQVLTVVRPETLVHWHRAGFRCYWRWKSRSRGGRPKIEADLRVLIRRMNRESPLWGAPRIHGELLKLGFQVAQSTVAKYMPSKFQNLSRGVRRQSLVFEIAQHIQPRQFVVAYDADRHPKHLPSCARAVSFQTGRGVTFSSGRYTARSYNPFYASGASGDCEGWQSTGSF